jgi:zinc protease
MFAIDVTSHRLGNGLQVLFYRNPALPLAVVNLWYHVGAANDPALKSGLAHIFEHMMFEGSANVAKGQHFYIIQQAGGMCNASTSTDRTNYYEKIPKQYLETALWLEADRMGNFIPALTQETLSNQIDVVTNERLERYDNQPYGLAHEKLLGLLFTYPHPYAKPIIGTKDEIGKYSLDDLSNFFRAYYAPGNASIVVAGGFNEHKALQLIEKHFGGIPAFNHTAHIPSHGELKKHYAVERYHEYVDNVELDKIYLAWHTKPVSYPESLGFDLLGDLLTGAKSALLTKALTIDTQKAQSVSASDRSGKYDGYFVISATAKPGVALDEIKTMILDELDSLKANGVNETQLARSKNALSSQFIYGLQNVGSLADQINSYDFYFGSPNLFKEEYTAMKEFSGPDIHRLALDYLTGDYSELRVLRRTK